MNEAQLRQSVAAIMQGWIGLKESNGGHKKIIDIYNGHKPLAQCYKVKYTDAWCAATVSAAFIKAGLTDIGFTECSCGRMINLYKKQGRWEERDSYTPKVGDLIMYDWQDSGVGDNTGSPDHVGMVVDVSGSKFTVVEGNKNDAVGTRTMTVNGKYIRGYCLPDYASKATNEAASTKTPALEAAKSFEKTYAKQYKVTASALHMRVGAGTQKTSIKILKKNAPVTCYGYYTQDGTTIWLCVVDSTGEVGYCSKKYLK